MKKLTQKIANYIMAFVMGIGLVAPAFAAVPVYADEDEDDSGGKPKAAILTGCAGEENGGGESVMCVVRLVADILSVLIGIVGVIGIVYVGIQYLSAGGNEEKARKAKRRLFEIVIGLVAYVAAYGLLKWLLPGFSS